MSCLSVDLIYAGPDFDGDPCSLQKGRFTEYFYSGSFNIGEQIFSNPPCSEKEGVVNPGMYIYGTGDDRVYIILGNSGGLDGVILNTGTCFTCVIGFIKFGSFYSYYDCCGQLITGTVQVDQLQVNLDITKPYTSNTIVVVQPPSKITPVCPSPTPTMTPTKTITPTPSVTVTSTVSRTPRPTSTPTPTPSNEKTIPIVVNTCDSITLFPMQIECNVISNPKTNLSTDGQIGINIIGGQGPYNITWAYDGSKGTTISNLPAGSYPVQVIDAYGDYNQTVVCNLSSSLNCNLEGTCTQVLNCDLQISVTARNRTSGGNNGALYVSISNCYGTPSILWSPGGQTTSFIDNLPKGEYTVTVEDTAVTDCVKTLKYVLN